MTRRTILFCLIALAFFSAFSKNPVYAQEGSSPVIHLVANGPLTPAMAEYLDRGLEVAERRNAAAVVFQLNTPGGSLDLMNRMVQSIRASQVPVVVYVAPRGALAGSAGTVLTMAGHIAAMAPETAIGAASPVGGQGEDLGETIESKLKEATKATIRTLMENRPPEAVKLAEDTIENAVAATANEAFEVGMIDVIAKDLPDLLQQIDGTTVTTTAGERTLQTEGVVVTELLPTLIEQLLSLLTNPNVVFILLWLGAQAVLIELGSPGGWVAGFLGVVFLTLAAYGLGVLEVNWLGLIFIVTAFVLFVLEIKAVTHGALTAAGVASFVVGALILFNSPGTPQFQRVSAPLVIGSGLFIGATFFVVLMFAIRAQKTPIWTGQESLAGRTGVAQSDLMPSGIVQLGGEQWTAQVDQDDQPIPRGSKIKVVRAEGLRLFVRRVDSEEE